MPMKYQFELKVHGQSYDLNVEEDDFSLYLYRSISEDFEIGKNNSRISALRAYVKVCHQLFLQNESVDEIVHRIEQLT